MAGAGSAAAGGGRNDRYQVKPAAGFNNDGLGSDSAPTSTYASQPEAVTAIEHVSLVSIPRLRPAHAVNDIIGSAFSGALLATLSIPVFVDHPNPRANDGGPAIPDFRTF
jgi:hypothetical protein